MSTCHGCSRHENIIRLSRQDNYAKPDLKKVILLAKLQPLLSFYLYIYVIYYIYKSVRNVKVYCLNMFVRQ